MDRPFQRRHCVSGCQIQGSEGTARHRLSWFDSADEQRGNREIKLPHQSRTLLNRFIEQNYETFKQKSKFVAWAALLHACEEKGVAPSYEFRSTYFETLLARYECIKKTRPPAKARFGSYCERLFGTTNTQFIHNLRGNTQITRNVRQVTRSVNPKTLAAWTLGDLHERTSEYLYEVYDTIEHPALGQSPRDAFHAGLECGGFRLQRMIPYDQEFLIATLPATPRGTAVVACGRGVKINHIYYWSDRFREPGIENERIPVRYDPFDAGTAYTFVANQWVVCRSEHFAAFQGRSEKEVMIASREIQKRRQEHSRRGGVTARRLADFLVAVESDEVLLQQRLRDREGTATRSGGAK